MSREKLPEKYEKVKPYRRLEAVIAKELFGWTNVELKKKIWDVGYPYTQVTYSDDYQGRPPDIDLNLFRHGLRQDEPHTTVGVPRYTESIALCFQILKKFQEMGKSFILSWDAHEFNKMWTISNSTMDGMARGWHWAHELEVEATTPELAICKMAIKALREIKKDKKV